MFDFYKKYLAKTNKTLYEHTLDLLGVLKNIELYRQEYLHLVPRLRQACIYHDIGKINDIFQYRIQNNMRSVKQDELPHNVVSFFMYLCMSAEKDLEVAYAILLHHGHEESISYLQDKENNLGVLHALPEKLDTAILEQNYDYYIEQMLNLHETKLYNKDLLLLEAFLQKIDYMASCNYNFIDRATQTQENYIILSSTHLKSMLQDKRNIIISMSLTEELETTDIEVLNYAQFISLPPYKALDYIIRNKTIVVLEFPCLDISETVATKVCYMLQLGVSVTIITEKSFPSNIKTLLEDFITKTGIPINIIDTYKKQNLIQKELNIDEVYTLYKQLNIDLHILVKDPSIYNNLIYNIRFMPKGNKDIYLYTIPTKRINISYGYTIQELKELGLHPTYIYN